MTDIHLYATILGIQAPWRVTQVDVRAAEEGITVTGTSKLGATFECPPCGQAWPGYDSRRRSWRHLGICQAKTIVVADVARVKCSAHDVVQIAAAWAEPGSGFTVVMESLIIDKLREASIAAAARRVNLSWGEFEGAMQRAVRRVAIATQARSRAAPRCGRDGVRETARVRDGEQRSRTQSRAVRSRRP